MKVVYIDRHGPPEVLTYGDMPDPVAGPGRIVVVGNHRLSPVPGGRRVSQSRHVRGKLVLSTEIATEIATAIATAIA